MKEQLLVSLIFHKFGPPRYIGDTFSLSPDLLQRIISVATEHGGEFVDWNHVRTGTTGKRTRLIALTFDDGFASDYIQVLPILQAQAISATFFIIPGMIGQPDYLSWNQVRALADAGMAIGSHSLKHTSLPTLSEKDLHKELAGSKQILEDVIGTPIKLLSIPYGLYNRRVLTAAWKAGYEVIGTSDLGVDRLRMRLAGERLILKRNGVVTRTAWAELNAMVQGKIPWQVHMREGSKAAIKQVMGVTGYQRIANLGRWVRTHLANY